MTYFSILFGGTTSCISWSVPRIGLDLVQPPAFLAGLIFVQMVFTAAQNMTSMWPQCAAAVLMPAWVMVFQCLGALSALSRFEFHCHWIICIDNDRYISRKFRYHILSFVISLTWLEAIRAAFWHQPRLGATIWQGGIGGPLWVLPLQLGTSHWARTKAP